MDMTTAGDMAAGMDPKRGTASTVCIDFSAAFDLTDVVKDGGSTSAQTVLAHELSHAYYDKYGVTAVRGSNPREPLYEQQAVGLGKFAGGRFNENKIRKEQGENARLSYSPPPPPAPAPAP